MANRSFLLCQRWLKNVFPSVSILTISLPAFSNHFLLPSIATALSSVFHASNISLYVPCIFHSSVMYTSPFFWGWVGTRPHVLERTERCWHRTDHRWPIVPSYFCHK
ncbi:unnamed protein product [Ectocarpus sp. 6 AP-2014]